MASELLFLLHLGVFGAAALACFGTIPTARQISDPDTRRGIVWLLVTSGGWATAHAGFLLVPTPALKTAFYIGGLIIGLSAVGPWLYFCSAYTGRSLHRNHRLRHIAVGVFLAIIGVKLTNPLHQQYFTTEFLTTPFPHLAVHHSIFHWLVMGLAYALAIVGYFMLLELFLQVSYDTKPFIVLVSITGLPIVLDVIGLQTPWLLNITYEPLGVAVFAVGVCYLYLDRFQTIRLAAGRDEPVIVLDDQDQIRDYNERAAELIPKLGMTDVIGEPAYTVIPEIVEVLETDRSIIEREQDDTQRYYRVSENQFGTEQTQLGRTIMLTDITHRERYRQELERQNERLEQFASMVSHDLRNPLNVAAGRLEMARQEYSSEHLEAVADAHARMEALIEDVLALARQGQPIDDPEGVELATVADQAWTAVESKDAELVVSESVQLMADGNRLQQLFENLFRNAIEHGGPAVTIRVGTLETGDNVGFYVSDTGSGIPEDEQEDVFASGYTTAEGGTGFGLAIVKEIVKAHGWEIRVTDGESGGARFEIRGIETVSKGA